MITTYQIRNVLRVYGDQLKKRNAQVEEKVDSAPQPVDYVDISIEARRKQMVTQMSNNIISQIHSQAKEGRTDAGPAPYNKTVTPEKGMIS